MQTAIEMVAPQKEAAWSYSKLTSFEVCPRRYYEIDVLKNWPKERSAQLDWGDDVHEAMAKALRTGEPLPLMFQIFQKWIDKINAAPGELLIEEQCRWAITRDFVPTTWFSNKVWLRCIADAVKINKDVALVVDWKTGKSRNADPVQLMLTSLMMLIQYPKLQSVRSDFVWLQEDTNTTQVLYRNEAADQWAEIMPRVEKLQLATANEEFPPRPNRFCEKWCPVRTCEYFGTRQ